MSERPVLILVLQQENAVEKARRLIGPTNPDFAPKSTIRSAFGTCTLRNVIHASDSRESAKDEIARFFHASEIFAIEPERMEAYA
jgi:nucleoside-diphosphate kinase